MTSATLWRSIVIVLRAGARESSVTLILIVTPVTRVPSTVRRSRVSLLHVVRGSVVLALMSLVILALRRTLRTVVVLTIRGGMAMHLSTEWSEYRLVNGNRPTR